MSASLRFAGLCAAVFVLGAGCASAVTTIDLDGDGLNDLWTLEYNAAGVDPLADADGDGESNLVESLLWTDPRDAASNSKAQLTSGSAHDILCQWLGDARPRALQPHAGAVGIVLRPEEVAYLRERLTDTDRDGLTDFEERRLGLNPRAANSRADWSGGDAAWVVAQLGAGAELRLGDRVVHGAKPTPRQAARFMAQASLGATSEDLAQVQALGFAGWLERQFAIPASNTSDESAAVISTGKGYDIHRPWWRVVLTGDDLLRQRMAVAWTEIYVISEKSVGVVWETNEYYDDLARRSFGNWRELLRMVTYDPLMGHYLSHLMNRKADPKLQRYPDENYAREVMQLFSIGLWELNPDGTRKLDMQGRPIPTYDNDTITNFARVFTGFGFGGGLSNVDNPQDFFDAPKDYAHEMKLWESEHDRDAKTLLRGKRLPAFSEASGRTARDDVEDALDNLYQHPNVGPFIGRLLIQRLVTSNPSPDYLRRVTFAFNNNGRGERGDLQAVIRAILLDPEARNYDPANPRGGRLREPYLRYVRLARTFHARSAEGTFHVEDHDTLELIDQTLLNSRTVFNFFLPDYQPAGRLAEAGLYAPEFQITTSTTALTALNLYHQQVTSGFGETSNPATVMRLNFDEEIKLADQPDALIDLLDLKMAFGELSAGTKKILRAAWSEMPAGYSAEERVKALVQLIATSPDFAVFQ